MVGSLVQSRGGLSDTAYGSFECGMNGDIVAPVAIVLLSGDVLLKWDISPSIYVTYNVYRSETPGVYATKLNRDPIRILGYRDDTTQAGKTYYYVVRAVDVDGIESPLSNEIKIVR